MVSLAAQTPQELTQRLPSYMIPSVFLLLVYMSLTASEKTDRRMISTFGDSLSLVDLSAATSKGPVTMRGMPTTTAEVKMQGLWADTLHYPWWTAFSAWKVTLLKQ